MAHLLIGYCFTFLGGCTYHSSTSSDHIVGLSDSFFASHDLHLRPGFVERLKDRAHPFHEFQRIDWLLDMQQRVEPIP